MLYSVPSIIHIFTQQLALNEVSVLSHLNALKTFEALAPVKSADFRLGWEGWTYA